MGSTASGKLIQENSQVASRPCPGALLLCAEALCLGLASTTMSLLEGGCGIEDFADKFRNESVSAATAAQPICGYMLREQVFNDRR